MKGYWILLAIGAVCVCILLGAGVGCKSNIVTTEKDDGNGGVRDRFAADLENGSSRYLCSHGTCSEKEFVDVRLKEEEGLGYSGHWNVAVEGLTLLIEAPSMSETRARQILTEPAPVGGISVQDVAKNLGFKTIRFANQTTPWLGYAYVWQYSLVDRSMKVGQLTSPAGTMTCDGSADMKCEGTLTTEPSR